MDSDDWFLSQKTEKLDDVSKLLRAWKNEQLAPDLLPFQSALVAELLGLVNQQQEVVDETLKSAEHRFKAHFFQMELERVRYMLQCYLRIRLQKISKYHQYILQNEHQKALLSPEEIQFAQGYAKAVTEYMHQSFLQYLDPSLQSQDDPTMIREPNIDGYVFIKVKEEIGVYQLSETNKEDSDNLKKDAIMLVPYRPIKPLLREHKIDLI